MMQGNAPARRAGRQGTHDDPDAGRSCRTVAWPTAAIAAFLLASPPAYAPAQNAPPATRAAAEPDTPPARQAIEAAIEKATKYLFAQQGTDGNWPAQGKYADAPTALAIFALLRTDIQTGYPKIQQALQWLKDHRTGDIYCYGLRAVVWGRAGWFDNQWREQLRQDAHAAILTIPPPPRTAAPRAADDPNQAFWIVQGLLPAEELV